MIPGETFFILSPETIARLVAIMLAIASLFLCLAKLKTLHQENVDINPALYILTLYFLYQAIWIFFLFIEGDKQAIKNIIILSESLFLMNLFDLETHLLQDLTFHFNKSYVSHFIKNIQKAFLVTIIGVPFVRSCILMNDQYNEKLDITEENSPEEVVVEDVENGTEKEIDEESSEKSDDHDDDGGERRKSVTTFFSFTGNEVYHEVEDENGSTHYATDEEGINRSM